MLPTITEIIQMRRTPGDFIFSTFHDHKLSLIRKTMHDHHFYILKNGDMTKYFNVTVSFDSGRRDPSLAPVTSNFLMRPISRKYIRTPLNEEVTIFDAEPVDFPGIVGRRDTPPMNLEVCTFSVGEDAIFVQRELLRYLHQTVFKQLLDANECYNVVNVEFPVFLEFFKLIFQRIPCTKLHEKYDLETCRKLMDLYHRFYVPECRRRHSNYNFSRFFTVDFYSDTNVFCVFGRPAQKIIDVPSLSQSNYQNNMTGEFPVIWSTSYEVNLNEVDKEKLMKKLLYYGLNWTFYICIEKINNIQYLGIGVIVEPVDQTKDSYRYFYQPAELRITIRSHDSSFHKHLTIFREFNHYQSSVGCPVIARMEEVTINQDENMIVDIEVRHNLHKIAEFAGEKDISLVIGDKTIYTSKNLLIHYFEYFKTLFVTNFNDQKQKEVVLCDVKYQDIYNIMNVIYNRSKSHTVIELEGMLILAIRFSCPYIIEYVDIAISTTPSDSLKRAIDLISHDEKKYFAEKYNQLFRVKENVRHTPHNRLQDYRQSWLTF